MFNWQGICRRCRSLADDDLACLTRANVFYDSSATAAVVDRQRRRRYVSSSVPALPGQPGRGGRAIEARRLLGLGERSESQRLSDKTWLCCTTTSSSNSNSSSRRISSRLVRDTRTVYIATAGCVAWHNGRTLVFDRRTFPVLRSTYS